jgi:hypothetical protein
VKALEGLCAVVLFALALYLFLLEPERRTALVASVGIRLQPATLLIVSIQGMAIGVIFGIRALLKRSAPVRR